MADEKQEQHSESKEFHVPLEANDAALHPEDELLDQDESEDTAPTADEAVETKADAEDEPTPPTAEEAGIDTSTPEGKRQYNAVLAKWSQWTQRFHAKHKQAATPAAPAAETPAQAPAAPASDEDDPMAALYVVDWNTFKGEPTKLAEDHELHGYESALDEIIDKRVQARIQHTLDSVRANDKAFRERMTHAERESKARDVIVAYAQEIQDHPEAPAKAAQLQNLAEQHRKLAIEYPDLFVQLVERETGLTRGWRGSEESETSERETQRLATAARRSVARPTNGSALGAPRGSLSGNAAFDAAWNARRH